MGLSRDHPHPPVRVWAVKAVSLSFSSLPAEGWSGQWVRLPSPLVALMMESLVQPETRPEWWEERTAVVRPGGAVGALGVPTGTGGSGPHLGGCAGGVWGDRARRQAGLCAHWPRSLAKVQLVFRFQTADGT